MRKREMEMSMEMRQDPAPRADTPRRHGVMTMVMTYAVKLDHMKLAN
jgi:hypothetical protein